MPASSIPRCSVVIRAFNEEDHIGRLLSGILEQTIEEVEILLVDSGSTDATVAIASQFPVRVLSIAPQDFTFGRSLNVGCAAARGEFIVAASAHVYPVYKTWLQELLAPFSDPQVALVYGRQRGDGRTRFSEAQQFAKMFPGQSNPRQTHPLCNNANAAIRRALWEQHAYNENLTGLEDLDWASWALEQGYYLAYAAPAEVVHVHEESPRQVFRRYEREAMALATIRPQERFHLFDLLRLFITNVASDLRQAGREGSLLREAWDVLLFRWMQFSGTYAGFRNAGPPTSEVIRAFYYPPGTESGQDRAGRSPDRLPIDYTSEGPGGGGQHG